MGEIIDRRIRNYKQVAGRNRTLGEQVQALTTERDGLLASLFESEGARADAERSRQFAEELAVQAKVQVDHLEAERDQLLAEVVRLRQQVSTSHQATKES